MDQSQNDGRPALITVIAVLLILAGIFAFLGISAVMGLIGLGGGAFSLTLASLLALWGVIAGAIDIVVGIGFFMMKKWALYLYTIVTAISLIQTAVSSTTHTKTGFSVWGLFAVQVLILAYLWSERRKFA